MSTVEPEMGYNFRSPVASSTQRFLDGMVQACTNVKINLDLSDQDQSKEPRLFPSQPFATLCYFNYKHPDFKVEAKLLLPFKNLYVHESDPYMTSAVVHPSVCLVWPCQRNEWKY